MSSDQDDVSLRSRQPPPAPERKPVTFRATETEKTLIKGIFGTVQAAWNKILQDYQQTGDTWNPRLPLGLYGPYESLREMAIPTPNRMLTYWDAMSSLMIEFNWEEKKARRTLRLLHLWGVIRYRLGLYPYLGVVYVATTAEEYDALNS